MKEFFAMFLVIFVVAMAALVCAAEVKKPVVDIIGGSYQVEGDTMIVQLDYPLANNRDTLVGNYVAAPGGGQKLNMDAEKDLTENGRQLREQLLAIKTDSGLFALRSVIVQYNSVIVTKYARVEWSDIVKTVEAAFKEAGKGKVKKK
jgi:hypothetical protein